MNPRGFLITYDEVGLATRLSAALRELGYFFPFVFDRFSQRADAAFQSALAEATLVILDARQRERDWPAIAELLRGLIGKKTVAVLTVTADEEDLRFFAGCGVTAFLDCQASVEELLAWLRQLLEKKTESG